MLPLVVIVPFSPRAAWWPKLVASEGILRFSSRPTLCYLLVTDFSSPKNLTLSRSSCPDDIEYQVWKIWRQRRLQGSDTGFVTQTRNP